MSGAIALLLCKGGGGSMNRRLFPAEQEARDWAATQAVPPWAFGWWVEVFDEEGRVSHSQAVKPKEESSCQ